MSARKLPIPTRPPLHRPFAAPSRDAPRRLGACASGYDRTWAKLRRVVIAEQPFCLFCERKGVLTPSRDVDHILPIAERPDLRLVRSNLRGLCHSCHSRRTALETRQKAAW